MVIWTLTSADQCTSTDACGEFSTMVGSGVIRMNLITNIPTGKPRPIIEFVTPYANPQINITKSLSPSITQGQPTFFGVKVESYDKCNGIPRYKYICCSSNTLCLPITNDYELPIMWNSYFKCKVTVRAVSGVFVGTYMSYSIYETTFDISANITTLGYPFDNIRNMSFVTAGTSQNGNITWDLCGNF